MKQLPDFNRMRRPDVGDRIKLTADYLRSTGQLVGGEGRNIWTVVSCDCQLCQRDFVAVNEPTMFRDEVDGPRHFNVANIQRVGELVADRVPQAGFLKLERD